MKRWIFVAGVVGGLADLSEAQDSHYWTTQFGNRARLLGGAVVGSEEDVSAVFYNPGALARREKIELLLSGTVFQVEKFNVSDALGPGVDLSNSRWTMVPSLFAGELRFGALGENRVAYAFLTRYDSEFRLNEYADVTDSLRPTIPGVHFASKEVEFETRLREYWIGGAWSRKIRDNIAVGVSPFFAVRNHRARAQALAQALGQDGEGGVALDSRDFDYQHWRFLAKAGISAQFEVWELGLTFTTPSLGLFGDGRTGIDESAVGQDVDQDGSERTLLVSNAQEGLDSDYRSPFSIAIGAARRLGRNRIHFSAEWFDGAGPITLLAPEPFVGQSTGETVLYDTVQKMDPVLNAAFGLERELENGKKLYAAFSTDFSNVAKDFPERSSIASASTWDIYHLSGGLTFRVSGQDLTLGLTYSFGSSAIGENDMNLNPALGVSYRRITFVIGAGFLF